MHFFMSIKRVNHLLFKKWLQDLKFKYASHLIQKKISQFRLLLMLVGPNFQKYLVTMVMNIKIGF